VERGTQGKGVTDKGGGIRRVGEGVKSLVNCKIKCGNKLTVHQELI